MPSTQPVEVIIDLTLKDGGYHTSVLSGTFRFETEFSQELSASIREEMRLLRWKAVGLHDPGDVLLIEVGRHLSELIFPPSKKDEWAALSQTGPFTIRVLFGTGTNDLLHLPWELLRIDDRFVLQNPESHVIRDLPSTTKPQKNLQDLRLLHVSLGVDSVLRLDQERATLLDALPESCPATFLLSPTVKEIEEAIAALKPTILVVSGHGAYDDLTGKHTLGGVDGPLPTDSIISLAGKGGCGLLLLWTCESARLSSGTPELEDTSAPTDVISFTYPVRSDTALSAVQVFVEAIVAGSSTDRAMALVRQEENEDVYSFFNVVHYHQAGHSFFQLVHPLNGHSTSHATPCAGRESDLLALDRVARKSFVTTIVAAVGADADSLIKHWADINSRSGLEQARYTQAESVEVDLRTLVKGVKWIVLDDADGSLPSKQISNASVRSVSFKSYRPVRDESVVVIGGIEISAAMEEALQLLGEDGLQLVQHPLFTTPMFLQSVAAGLSPDEAVERFEQDNDMPARYANLGNAGKLFASMLYSMRGSVTPPGGDLSKYARDLTQLGLDGQMMVAGIDECIRAKIIIVADETLVLAPEFLLLGDKWFPNWRTEHIRMFQTMCAVFATLAENGKIDIDLGKTLLGWGAAVGAWKEVGLICVSLCMWHFENGLLDEMEDALRMTIPNVTGEERVVLEGNLASILTASGRFADGLELHREVEKRVRSLPQDEDYFLNLIACQTQQVDCLIELEELGEAEELWHEASLIAGELKNPRADVEARLTGQLARIREEQGNLDAGLQEITKAIQIAEKCPGTLLAELRVTKCDLLRALKKFDEAEIELQLIEPLAASGHLRSRYLHLKGLLMEAKQDPQWVEHILESLEHDRQRDDSAGVAISLVTLARIFIDQGEFARAKDRLREALPYVQRSGLMSVMGTFARLWGEIEIAEGSPDSARAWFEGAKEYYSEGGDSEKSKEITRLLEGL